MIIINKLKFKIKHSFLGLSIIYSIRFDTKVSLLKFYIFGTIFMYFGIKLQVHVIERILKYMIYYCTNSRSLLNIKRFYITTRKEKQ